MRPHETHKCRSTTIKPAGRCITCCCSSCGAHKRINLLAFLKIYHRFNIGAPAAILIILCIIGRIDPTRRSPEFERISAIPWCDESITTSYILELCGVIDGVKLFTTLVPAAALGRMESVESRKDLWYNAGKET